MSAGRWITVERLQKLDIWIPEGEAYQMLQRSDLATRFEKHGTSAAYTFFDKESGERIRVTSSGIEPY